MPQWSKNWIVFGKHSPVTPVDFEMLPCTTALYYPMTNCNPRSNASTAEQGAESMILNALDQIAWLTNLRVRILVLRLFLIDDLLVAHRGPISSAILSSSGGIRRWPFLSPDRTLPNPNQYLNILSKPAFLWQLFCAHSGRSLSFLSNNFQ